MLIIEFIRCFESVVPLSAIGYERDAVGMQVSLPRDAKLTNVLFAYEVTSEVVAEAKERGANLIVAFHPLIFPTVSTISDATRTGSLIRALIKSDIALYIVHTAFDTQSEFGTSRLMAEALGLDEIESLVTEKRGFGMGTLGIWPEAKQREEVLRLIAEIFDVPVLRLNSLGPNEIRRVAMVGGSGMDFYPTAAQKQADLYITADVRYHDFYRADHDGVLLIDAGHAETEKFVTRGMAMAARKAIKLGTNDCAVPEDSLLLARTEPNSVCYFLK